MTILMKSRLIIEAEQFRPQKYTCDKSCYAKIKLVKLQYRMPEEICSHVHNMNTNTNTDSNTNSNTNTGCQKKFADLSTRRVDTVDSKYIQVTHRKSMRILRIWIWKSKCSGSTWEP